MLAFPAMLLNAAETARMKTPENPDSFNADDFPHFRVFCVAQLNHPMTPGAHFENAKVIAAIPEDKIREFTFDDLLDAGFTI